MTKNINFSEIQKNHPRTLEDCKNDCMCYCDTLEKIL